MITVDQGQLEVSVRLLARCCASPAIAGAGMTPKAAIVSICEHARLAADTLQDSSRERPRSTREQVECDGPALYQRERT